MLDLHHSKNKTIRPPNPNSFHSSGASRGNHGQSSRSVIRSGSREASHHPASHGASHRPASRETSHHPQAVSREASHHPQAASREASHRPASRGASRHDASHHPQAASRDSPEAGLDTNNGDDRDHDSDRLGDDRKNRTRATRNSKSNGDAKPNQLGFYSGAWVDILITARNNFRKMIHAESGPTHPSFPERNPENLRRAQDHLIEAVAEYSEENGQQLDNGMSQVILQVSLPSLKLTNNIIEVYNINSSGMISYVGYNLFLLRVD